MVSPAGWGTCPKKKDSITKAVFAFWTQTWVPPHTDLSLYKERSSLVLIFFPLFAWVGFITSSHVRNGNCMMNPRGFCSSLTGKRFSFCHWHQLPPFLFMQSKVIEILCVLSLKWLLFDSHWTVDYINCSKGSWVILVDFWSCFITAMLIARGHLRTPYGQMQLFQNHLRLEATKEQMATWWGKTQIDQNVLNTW